MNQFLDASDQYTWLMSIGDHLARLRIYASRYRVGAIAPSGSPVKARTVEAALRAVGQTFTALGYRDPRLQDTGKMDFRLHRQLQAYSVPFYTSDASRRPYAFHFPGFLSSY